MRDVINESSTRLKESSSEKNPRPLSQLNSGAVVGVKACPIEVEVHFSVGQPSRAVVGLPDAAVKESSDRVQAAIQNSGFKYEVGRVIVNLAPADIRKEGPMYDLPIALGVLEAQSQLDGENFFRYVIVGELALNGSVRPVRGILPIALMAKEMGKKLIVPRQNIYEAAVVEGLEVYGVSSLREVTDFILGNKKIEATPFSMPQEYANALSYDIDFADVKGQESVKRAIEVSVAGGHNLLLIGPPGSGKSMLAKRIPTIIPEMTLEEALETTKVHSVVGLLQEQQQIVWKRPFRSPHHTVSDVGLIGGSAHITPGEVSLAHNGVLFLDELPEFKRSALEALRQPLEDGRVTISRAAGSITFPARFMLVAAMNPTPTGSFEDINKGKTSAQAVQKYLNKISGPLLDRMDIHLEVTAVSHSDLMRKKESITSAEIKQRVTVARKIQWQRYQNSKHSWCNAQMSSRELKKYCVLSPACENLLEMAMRDLDLSARAHDRILKVARTIADLAQCPEIKEEHLGEAIQYRSLDRKFWG